MIKLPVKFRLTVAGGLIAASSFGAVVAAQEDPPTPGPEIGYCYDEATESNRDCEPGEFPPVEEGFFFLRLGGSNRYETAALVEGLEFIQGNLLVVASAEQANLVDSLFALDNISRHPNATFLPVPADGDLPLPITQAIHDLTDITFVVVIGGRGAVSDVVFAQVVAVAARGAGPGR